MIRYGLALVLLLLTVDTADACSRCGLFGSRCRFRKVSYPVRKVYVKKAVPSVVPQTIIINNAGTVPSVISQGSTAYGYRQSLGGALQPYRTSSADLLHLAERRASGVDTLAQLASQQMNSETEVNRLLGSAQALTMTINAARENTAQLSAPQSFVVTIGPTGQAQLQSLQAYRAAQVQQSVSTPGTQQNTAPSAQAGILSLNCAKCHGADKASPAGGLFVHDQATFSVGFLKKVRGYLADSSTIQNEEMKQTFTAINAGGQGDELTTDIVDRLE